MVFLLLAGHAQVLSGAPNFWHPRVVAAKKCGICGKSTSIFPLEMDGDPGPREEDADVA
jgi:hypothetical protein